MRIAVTLLIPLLLLFATTTTTTVAFAPLPVATFATARLVVFKKRSLVKVSSAIHDDAIARLQNEYKELEDNMYQDVKDHKVGEVDVAAYAEAMVEKAAEMVSFQRYKDEEAIGEADAKLAQAKQDLRHAQARRREAHDQAVGAAEQAALIESIDAAYEDLERLRDLSVVHAARHLEEDTSAQIVEAQFQELDAKMKREYAVDLLKQLEQNEEELKALLKGLKDSKNELAMKKWADEKAKREPAPKTQDHSKLIDHDPTKGDIAF
jgi:hypothetical protein